MPPRSATTALVALCARTFADERDKPEELKSSPADDLILDEFLAREIERRSNGTKSRLDADNLVKKDSQDGEPS